MKKGTQLSPELGQARKELNNMLVATQVVEGETVPRLTMEDRLLVIDRLIKIEALEHKMGIGRAGSAFDDDEEAE